MRSPMTTLETEMLDKICTELDKYGVTIEVRPHSLGVNVYANGVGFKSVTSWYTYSAVLTFLTGMLEGLKYERIRT